jgi:cyclopropane fatty-acyl-phospholipid synthase-like methyltransferase
MAISDPRDLASAWSQQYARVAREIGALLPPNGGLLVEVGSGKGQLTIPLAKRATRYQIVALDRFKGPYSGDETRLLSAIARSRMKGRIRVVVGDYDNWLKKQAESTFDVIISSEFLPEIDSKRMRDFFAECYRILKTGGLTIHSFLSGQPRNIRQERLIEADTDPRWTKTPPLEWFSPSRKLVLDYLKLAGFVTTRPVRLKSGLVIRSDAARELLKDWDVRQTYWRSHREILETEGLEIPDWLIICGVKGSRRVQHSGKADS